MPGKFISALKVLKPRKRVAFGNPNAKLSSAFNNLKIQRRESIIAESLAGASAGIMVGLVGSFLFGKHMSPKAQALYITGSGAIMAVVGAVYAGRTKKANVRRATIAAGKVLSAEYDTNEKMRAIVDSYPYIFINRKMQVVGAYTKSAGLGRIRLKSEDIQKNRFHFQKTD